jgi:hypothetical protein
LFVTHASDGATDARATWRSLPAVTADVPPEEPDDGERRELTPEERETVRRSAEALRRSMPKFDLKIPKIVDSTEFSKMAADAARLSKFTFPAATLKNFSA